MLDNYNTVVSPMSMTRRAFLRERAVTCGFSAATSRDLLKTSRMAPMRRAAAALFAAAWLALAAPATAADHDVNITAGGYDPVAVNVQTGDRVVWHNMDTKRHTATDVKGTFDTGEIQPHQSKALTFFTPGTYTYKDQDNAAAQGTITVTQGPSSTTTVTFQQTTTTTARSTTTTTVRSTTTSALSTTTSSTAPPTTFAFDTVPGQSTTTTLSGAASGPTSHSGGSSSVTGPGVLAALLLLGTSGATLLAARRAH
jgi:plastocyanin